MLNNFIGGGQVFLHKVRMFKQVAGSTFKLSLLIGICMTVFFRLPEFKSLDTAASMSYVRAHIAMKFHEIIPSHSGNRKAPTINAYTSRGLFKNNVPAKAIITSNKFKSAYSNILDFLFSSLMLMLFIAICSVLVVFGLWSRFGKSVRSDKKQEGSGVVLTDKEVTRKLKSLRMASDLAIGKMSLVKDMETRHFLATGSTGSGKTNLIHNLLSQIQQKQQPAIVIDQTGEMIARYYNPDRGDIIFNPFDARGKEWDFWQDCTSKEELERFSKILFGFNRKKSNSKSDPFWEQSAEIVFNACAQYQRKVNPDIQALSYLLQHSTLNSLSRKLYDTEAARFLDNNNQVTSGSVLSTLSASSKPISYLKNSKDNLFSLKEYFQNIDQGANNWLFLATKPSSRELTASLIACLAELALCQLLDIGIKDDRRVWFVMDELASLGKLPALSTLMSEGRKYGACIICGLQSLNQLFSHYGQYDGSTIFGQFGTSFFFRNTEDIIARQVSAMSGSMTITRQQKNTSFGANEFRDGVSYNEHQQKKLLIEPSDLATLATGQCYTFLPELQVRLAKIQVPQISLKATNPSFIARNNNLEDDQDEEAENASDDSPVKSTVNQHPSPEETAPAPVRKKKRKIYKTKSRTTKSTGRTMQHM